MLFIYSEFDVCKASARRARFDLKLAQIAKK